MSISFSNINIIKTLLIFLLFISSSFYGQILAQIPKNPNLKDSKKQKQGKWTIWYDENWDEVNREDSAIYYRIIEYKNGKPIGITRDYYRSGKMQMEGAFFDEENWKANGIVQYYNELGETTNIDYYENGNFNFNKTLPLIHETINNHKKSKGENNPTFAELLMNLASTYSQIDDYKTQKSLLISSINIYSNLPNLTREQTKDYAYAVSDLASLYSDLYIDDSSKYFYEKCLQIIEKEFGKDDINFSVFLNNYAAYYFNKNDFKKAVELHKASSGIQKKRKGILYRKYAHTISKIGFAYRGWMKYDSAIFFHNEALRIFKEIDGVHSYDYINSLRNLSYVYSDQWKYDKAIELLSTCQKFYLAMRDENELVYASILNELANAHLGKEDYKTAESFYLKALTIKENILGKNHLQCAEQLFNLAILYGDLDYDDKSVEYYLKSMEITKSVIGSENVDYAESMSTLGSQYQKMGRFDKALEMYNQCLPIFEEKLGKLSSSYQLTIERLGDINKELKIYDKAKLYFKENIKISKELSGEKSIPYARSLENLALLYETMELNQSADSAYNACLLIYDRLDDKNNLEYASLLDSYGWFCFIKDKYDLSLMYLNKSLALYEKLTGKNLSYIHVLRNISEVCNYIGETSKANKYEKEAENLEIKIKSLRK